ncbi:hypothetical protein NKI54_29745 [Mesorhizobium sp. M0663]|uniref:hypothetical protein n=1 Tax=Mesorhizobium sp. M0663 TaxID=2956981 RepID=UPI0033359204
MTLLAAGALDPKKFFREGSDPVLQGSSFDLTVGSIYDHEGKKVSGPFTLKQNHIVQVASAEVFNLPGNITGHVTYKTGLTSKGIWALTVGIVDPGWDGPVSTTLLNFSRNDHPISEGDPFLRVSFFEHDPVQNDKLRKAPTEAAYLKSLQGAAASIFPKTFLDSSKIADHAGVTAVTHMQNRGLIWVTCIAFLFAIIQILTAYLSPSVLLDERVSKKDVISLQVELSALKERLKQLEPQRAKVDDRMPAEALVPAEQPVVPPAVPEELRQGDGTAPEPIAPTQSTPPTKKGPTAPAFSVPGGGGTPG